MVTTDLYEAVRYTGHAFPQTHPDRLALLARLHGLAAAPPDRCRVLELGCGDGTNVVAMAAAAPGLKALGVDRAAGPLEHGRETARALDLDNVELLAADVRELPAARGGPYDYVIAHGVWSWVPADVRRALLDVCGRWLAPHGVAFVSYTALPGGALRAMTRAIGRRTAARSNGLAGAEQARATLGALAPWMQGREDPYARVLAAEADRVLGRPAHELVHDELGDVYHPTWVGDLAAAAADHGLQLLGEADPAELRDDWLPAGAEALLAELAGEDPVARAEAVDLLIGRTFRQTLLCRADATVTPPSPATMVGLLAGPERRPVSGDDAAATLARFRRGEEELHAAPARHVTEPGERPVAFAVARHEAAAGPDVTNLRHEHVRLEPSARELVRLLDGTRDRDRVAADLAASLNRPELAGRLRSGLDESLATLASVALLSG